MGVSLKRFSVGLEKLEKRAVLRFARRLARQLLDQILPPRCLVCGAGVQDTGRLCGDCWRELTFLQGPACDGCGYPFDERAQHLAEEKYCAHCQAAPPPFARARMALRYDGGSRGMILAFKHGDRLDYGPFLADLLGQAYGPRSGEEGERPPLVLPVPLHRKRLAKRRYNQAAVLSRAFARSRGFDFLADGLCRIKHTPPQEGNVAHRQRNVAGAFRFEEKYKALVWGRRVILVDDVYTTGATARACARILKRHGAVEVEVLTVARVCQPTQL